MIKYHTEFYNKCNDNEQWLRLGEGCLNNCEYCYAMPELISYDIPKIKRNKVKIIDMNFLYNPKHKERIKYLGSQKVNNKKVYYELVCGIDWRLLDQETANLLKQNGFINIRFAWDYGLDCQYRIKDCYNKLIKAGYKPKDLMVFMLCDWRVSFSECLMKLSLLKIWNVKVSDCYFDNVKPPNYKCNYWSFLECDTFRRICALHNQSLDFYIYPDIKRVKRCIRSINKLKEQSILFK